MTRKDWVQKSKHIRRNRMIRMHYGFVWNWSGKYFRCKGLCMGNNLFKVL